MSRTNRRRQQQVTQAAVALKIGADDYQGQTGAPRLSLLAGQMRGAATP